MNRLQYESSPYLLQHKDNPVDWYPWGDEAINKSNAEDKPILLSIGYSSCHWCHVMEHESFTDHKVASYMNEHFVCIKLDREERPDLDKIYMDAIVSLTGSGGWPLNCFLLPDLKPFYGGTYFPPVTAHQRPSWTEILQFIVRIYKERRADINEQADRMLEAINRSSNSLYEVSKSAANIEVSTEAITNCFNHLKMRFDRSHGGFGGAPKFPGTMALTFLLDYYFFYGDTQALDHVLFSLTKMAQAGIYDQLKGGFARYATDKEWNIPHFEKMLYDNAQLLSVFSKAYKFRKDPLFKKVITETTDWLTVDMHGAQGGYYSAIDADSDGEEGKYYIWTTQELQTILTENEYALAVKLFELQEEGNWDDPFHPSTEPKNILWINSQLRNIDLLFSKEFKQLQKKLIDYRSLRNHPLVDTKIIAAWNALLCLGWYDAYEATGEDTFLILAEENLHFILESCFNNNYLHQVGSPIPAMLDDLSLVIAACLKSYQLIGENRKLSKAIELIHFTLQHFYNNESNSFAYSMSKKDVITVVNDLYDNTLPSSSGMMVHNLVIAGRLTQNFDWESLAESIINDLQGSILKYPESLSHWASLLVNKQQGWLEIKSDTVIPKELISAYLSKAIFHTDPAYEAGFSLCHKFICEMSVNSSQKFRLLLDKHYRSIG